MNIKRVLFIMLLFFSVNVCYANNNCIENVDYKIVYNTVGGNKIDAYLHNKDEVVSDVELPVPIREGYKFDGWYYDLYLTKLVKAKYINEIEYTQKYYPNGCISLTTITLYAKWEKNDLENDNACNDIKEGFYIVYNVDGGEEIDPDFICASCGDAGPLITPKREGYQFEGWYYDSEYVRRIDVVNKDKIEYVRRKDENGCIIEGIINIYAKWSLKEVQEEVEEEKINYTINYHTNGGVLLSSNSVCDGCGSKTNLQIPTKEGYKFEGWYYDRELTKRVNTSYMEEVEHKTIYSDGTSYKENVVNLYANWKKDIWFVIKNILIKVIIIGLVVGGIILILFIYIKMQKKQLKKEEIETLDL